MMMITETNTNNTDADVNVEGTSIQTDLLLQLRHANVDDDDDIHTTSTVSTGITNGSTEPLLIPPRTNPQLNDIQSSTSASASASASSSASSPRNRKTRHQNPHPNTSFDRIPFIRRPINTTNNRHNHHHHHNNNHNYSDDDDDHDNNNNDQNTNNNNPYENFPENNSSYNYSNSNSNIDTTEYNMDLRHWFPTQSYLLYTHGTSDGIAGMIVGIMIVPQSMSYAKLAGLPVEYGLYSSLVPIATYALYGIVLRPTRQNLHSLLAIGPVALISLMLSSGISNIMLSKHISPSDNNDNNNNDNAQYTILYEQLAVQCSFFVGIISLLMGTCHYRSYNIGTIISQCLSHTVISGFTSGAAIIIALSQCKYIFGYTKVPSADTVPSILMTLWSHRNQYHGLTLIMGGLSLLILLLARHMSQYPIVKKHITYQRLLTLTPLLVTVTAVSSTILFQLHQHYHIMIVGTIPRGLPHTTVSSLMTITWHDTIQLLPVALSITIIGFMDTIAIARQLVTKQQQQQQQVQRVAVDSHDNLVVAMEVNTSQELIALGWSNVMGSLFHSYPVAGSFSRSAMNYSSGGQTRYSGIITAGIVAMALLILTPFFEQLPYNTLAAIVISGVIGLFDYNEATHLWNVDRMDCMVWCISCGCTMGFGCEYGLALAIASSFIVTLYKMTYLPIILLGRVPGTEHYRNIHLFPEAQSIDGIVIIRVGGPIYFANIPHIERTIQSLIYNSTTGSTTAMNLHTGSIGLDATSTTERNVAGPVTPCNVVVDMSCVAYMDATALRRLKHMMTTTSDMTQFYFTDVSKHIVQQFELSGLLESTINRDHIFQSVHDAVQNSTTQQQQQQQQIL